MKKITILGTGAYGIALSLMFHENNMNITMWTKFEEEKQMLDRKRTHEKFLPNVKIPNAIIFTTNLQEAVNDAVLIVLAIPAQFVRDTCIELKKYITSKQHILIASKGIENDSCKFMHEVVSTYINKDQVSVIAGPTFAVDIASYVPVALTLATTNLEAGSLIKETLQNKYLKIRTVQDIIGVEICSSIKNVMAIASGIISGMQLPISTQAMFITEALCDIQRLIIDLGGKPNTAFSFAGVGDLILTCTSEKSRNFTLGNKIGKEVPQEELEAYKKNTTIEGLYTLESIYKLLNQKSISIPLIQIIYDIIYGNEKKERLLSYLIEK